MLLIDVRHGNIGSLVAPLLSLERGLAVLVHLELGNNEAGGGDADGDGGAVGLLPGDVGNVNDHLFTVARSDLALAGLVHAAGDKDLVVLADGHGADTVTGYAQALNGTWDWYKKDTGNRGASRTDFSDSSDFELSPGLRVGREVSLAVLASAGRDSGGVLHLLFKLERQADCGRKEKKRVNDR